MEIKVNQPFYDSLMRRTIDLHKFGGSLNKKLSDHFKFLEDSICRVLVPMSLGMGSKKKRDYELQDLSENIDALLYSRFYQIDHDFNENLREVGLLEHDFIVDQIHDSTNEIPYSLPSTALLPTVSEPLVASKSVREWGDNIRRVLRRNLVSTVRSELATGKSTEDTIRKIKGDRLNGYRNGIFKPALGKLQTLFRSGITAVTNDVRQRVYSINSPTIESFYWNSTLDGNSSSICSHKHCSGWENPSLHPKGDSKAYRSGVPHFNCRSTIVPIFRSNTSVSQDGNLTSFIDWISGRTESEQRDIYGERKFSLWKKGKISSPQLINFKTSPITLYQLTHGYKGTQL